MDLNTITGLGMQDSWLQLSTYDTEDKFGYADLIEENSEPGAQVVKVTGIKNRGGTVSILAMNANNLVVEGCERSLHDALVLFTVASRNGQCLPTYTESELYVLRSGSATYETSQRRHPSRCS